VSDFPASPVPPADLLEGYLPRAWAKAGLAKALGGEELRLGLHLAGRGGGDWLIELRADEARVTRGSRNGAPLSLVQSVQDWRGALWEGRGGALGARAAELFRNGGSPGQSRWAPVRAAPLARALADLGALDGLLRLVVTGGKGGDWSLALRVGPGALPEAPTATLSLAAEDAAALLARELSPLEALLSGRLRLDGEMGFLLQLQGALGRLAPT